MPIAGCTVLDPILMSAPASAAQAGPGADSDSQGPASFLAAFGQAIDGAAQAEQQPALPVPAGAPTTPLRQVLADTPVLSEQMPEAVPDTILGEAGLIVTETADCGHPPSGPEVLNVAQVPGVFPAVSQQAFAKTAPIPIETPNATQNEAPPSEADGAVCATSSPGARPGSPKEAREVPPPVSEEMPAEAGPTLIPELEATQDAADVPNPEAAGRPRPQVSVRRASSEASAGRADAPGSMPAPVVATSSACSPTIPSRVPGPEAVPAIPGQGRSVEADSAKTLSHRSRPADEVDEFADLLPEGAQPVNPKAVSGTAEDSSTPGPGNRRYQDSSRPTEAPGAPVPADCVEAIPGDSCSMSARYAAVLRHQPGNRPPVEAGSCDGGPVPAKDSPEAGTVTEFFPTWESIRWLSASSGLWRTLGLQESCRPPASSNPPHLPLSADRLPVSERSEAFSVTFRPVPLIELLQPHAARAAGPEAPIHQGDESLTTPAPRPEMASDAFTRSGARSPQPPAADPAPSAPSATLSGRSLGFYFTVSDFARPSPAASTTPDAAGTGGAVGAAHHFSLLGRPLDASPVAQPPASLAFANADGLYLRLAEQVQLQVREGKSSMRIQLKPETLGRLEIRAESTAAGLTATITTENHGVKAFLEQNLHNLYRTLQDMGLKVDRILVTEEGSQHHAPGQFHDSEAHSGQERSYPSGEPAWLPGDPAALTEQNPAVPAVPNYWMPHSTFHAVA